MDAFDTLAFQGGAPKISPALTMAARDLTGLSGPMMNSGGSSISMNKAQPPPKKGPKSVNKKPPGAPKRFKSSFIFFSMAKHKEIKEQLNRQGETAKTTNITKMVSEAWRNMGAEEREVYDQMARDDKARYELEKANYQGPTGSSTRKQKDPNAPKRPMSAYLAFANGKRAEVKAQNPESSNGEISKILSQMWKQASDDDKKKFRDEEAALWETYRVVSLEWKKQNDGRKKAAKQAEAQNAKKKKKKKQKAQEEESPSFGSDFDVPIQSGGIGNFGGIDSLSGNPNEEEMMAASALRGVRGGSNFGFAINNNGNFGNVGASVGAGGNAALFQQQQMQQQLQQSQQRQQMQQLQQTQQQSGAGGGASLGSLFGNMNGMNPFGGGSNNGAGASAGFPSDIGNSPANARALLDLGYNPLQQLGGMMPHSLGNSQAMLMAQALRGSTGSYHNQLLGLVDQQPSLSQLASLAGPQAGGANGGGGALSAPGMINAGMGNLLNDNSTGSMNRMNNGMGGNHMGGMGGF